MCELCGLFGVSLTGHVHQMWAKVTDVGKARALISQGDNAPVSAGFLPACEVEAVHSVTQGVWFTRFLLPMWKDENSIFNNHGTGRRVICLAQERLQKLERPAAECRPQRSSSPPAFRTLSNEIGKQIWEDSQEKVEKWRTFSDIPWIVSMIFLAILMAGHLVRLFCIVPLSWFYVDRGVGIVAHAAFESTFCCSLDMLSLHLHSCPCFIIDGSIVNRRQNHLAWSFLLNLFLGPVVRRNTHLILIPLRVEHFHQQLYFWPAQKRLQRITKKKHQPEMSACKFNLKCGFVLKPLQHIPWLHTVGGGDVAVVAAKVLSKVPDQASLLGSWLRKAVFSTNQFETDKWSTWFPMRDVTKNHKKSTGHEVSSCTFLPHDKIGLFWCEQ